MSDQLKVDNFDWIFFRCTTRSFIDTRSQVQVVVAPGTRAHTSMFLSGDVRKNSKT